MKMQQEGSLKRFIRRIKTRRYRIWLRKRILACTVLVTVVSLPVCLAVGNEAEAKAESVEVVTVRNESCLQEALPQAAGEADVAETAMPVKDVAEEAEAVAVHSMAWYDVPLEEDVQFYIVRLCEENHIDASVVLGMAQRESSFTADAIGDGGESFGMFQVQPRWHQDRMDKLGVTNLLDPCQGASVAVDFLKELLDRYDGDMAKALTAYNQGSFKGVVSDYAKAVLENSENLKKGMVLMYYTDNPLADFERYDADQHSQLERRPVCADCGHHIQDETAYYINSEWICMDCMSSYEREVLPE